MKSPLQQALKGKSLRSDIFSTFHNRSLNSFSPFLKNSRQRDSRYLPYSSQHTVIRSQMESPNIRTDLSSQRFSPSPNNRFRREEQQNYSSESGQQAKIQRIKRKKGTSSKSKKKSRGNQIAHALSDSKGAVNGGKGNSSLEKKREGVSGSKGKKKGEKRGKSKESIKSSSKSKGKSSGNKSKGDSRWNLSSIIEHQSQERVITPSSKEETKRNKSKKAYHVGKTHKKSKCEELSEVVFKRIERICREPGKYLRLMKNDLLSIRHRVERRRIIELEVMVYKDIAAMNVILEKGNLQCQHIEERYFKLQANSKFTLFSSVREVNIQEPFKLPRIHIEITMQDGSIIQRHATIPYTWLQFSSQSHPRIQRSRILTKSFLNAIPIVPAHLRTLSLTLPSWTSRYSRHESRFSSNFSLGDSDFQLILCEHRGEWSIQLCGRGEQRLHRLILFLCEFLC